MEPEVLGRFLRKTMEKLPVFSPNPLGDWKDLVGDVVARYSRPVKLRHGRLVIVAHDAVWRHHLEMVSQALIEKINAGRPEELVREIVVRVGTLPRNAEPLNPLKKDLDNIKAASRRKPRRRKRKIPLRDLTEEEKKILQSISDPELRRIGRRLLRRTPIDAPEDSPTG